MTHKLIKTALALAAVGAVALPAGQAAAASKTESAILGALLGGVAGAAVSNGKTEGVAIGAVAGLALGAAVASDKDHDRRHRSGYAYRDSRSYYGDGRYQPYGRQGAYGETRYRYRDDGYGYGYRR